MKKFFKENQKGFTLIELLVVIAILAVLATLYVPKIVSSANDAKETVEIANARTLASEITTYNATATKKILGHEYSSTTDPSWASSGNLSVVSANDITSVADAAYLMDGRSFPSTSTVTIVTDGKGNCFIVNTEDGSAYTAN